VFDGKMADRIPIQTLLRRLELNFAHTFNYARPVRLTLTVRLFGIV